MLGDPHPDIIMKQTQLVERPQILTWGIILMAAKSALYLLLLMIGLVGVPIIFGLGAADSRGDDAVGIVLVGCFIEFIRDIGCPNDKDTSLAGFVKLHQEFIHL